GRGRDGERGRGADPPAPGDEGAVKRPLVLCLVFFGGLPIRGAGAWVGAREGGRPQPPAGRGAAAGAAPRRAAPARRPGGAARGESRPAVSAIRPKPFNDSDERLAADLGAEAVGTGTISGKVKNDRGQGIAGVVVQADFQGDRRDGRPPEWRNGDGPPPEKDM